MRTIAFRGFQGVALLYHCKINPSDQEWDQLIAFATQHILECERYLSLVVTEGGSPTNNQRKRLISAAKDTDATKVSAMRASIMTDNLMARGTINAFYWLGFGGIRAFRGDDLAGALNYLGVGADQVDNFAKCVEKLQKSVSNLQDS